MDKLKKIFTGKNGMIVVGLLGLYLISAGSSWAIFSYLSETPDVVHEKVSENRQRVDPSLPKTEECPINGRMFTKPERDIWVTRRPITAIIENHLDSRPPSGLSYADVVYEAIAEGGITRFLSVFYCDASASDVKIAPIRSVRVYFIDWAAEYGKEPIFVHIGGANNICNNCPGGVKPYGDVALEVDAFRMLSKLGWRYAKGNDFDGGTNVGYPIIIRDQYRLGDRADWEHSVVGSTDKIFEEAEKRNFGYENESGVAWDKNFVGWTFADDDPVDVDVKNKVSFSFGDKAEYDAVWKYNAVNNEYLRSHGDIKHVDHENGEQISAKNVVVQFVKERGPVDEEYHMIYTTTGKGEALVFQNGGVVKGTWTKKLQSSRTKFYDSDGEEISFVRGTIWIEAVPKGKEIDY